MTDVEDCCGYQEWVNVCDQDTCSLIRVVHYCLEICYEEVNVLELDLRYEELDHRQLVVHLEG